MRWAHLPRYNESRHVRMVELWRELERTRHQIDRQLDWWNDQGRTPDTRPVFLDRLSRKLATVKAQVDALESEQAG